MFITRISNDSKTLIKQNIDRIRPVYHVIRIYEGEKGWIPALPIISIPSPS